MPADADLDDLHPLLKPLAEQFIADWARTYPSRYPVKIIQTWRSPAYQEELHAANPTGAAPTGKSKHEFTVNGKPAAKAFDFALFDEDGAYMTDGTDSWFADAGALGKALGLVWGGDFVHAAKDWDHLELPS